MNFAVTWYMDVSKNRGTQIIHFNVVFFSPSILGAHPYFWKHPYVGFSQAPNSFFKSDLGWVILALLTDYDLLVLGTKEFGTDTWCAPYRDLEVG